ncbi:MAG TPA: SGNH/GDSL hydrolase family protein [Puia sp.]|nr:SGNH/GDSL hydrolase family protein [Puia sp.]
MYHYLALGDSYTIGESVPAEDRFPVQTTGLLKQGHIFFEEPEIIAVTGWSTADLLRATQGKRVPVPAFDVVSLLIGVNNQYRGRSREEYAEEFTTLLQRAIKFAGNRPARVFVLSIPDYAVTPFGLQTGQAGRIAREIDAFNEINQAISGQYSVNYIDITAASRMAAEDRALLADDGLHYSAREYAVWARLLSEEIRKVLLQREIGAG